MSCTDPLWLTHLCRMPPVRHAVASLIHAELRADVPGARLVRAVLDEARRLGEGEVFLGTDGPGFDERLGARVQQQPRPGFWLLRFDLV